jgi:hypothetical protein
MEMVKVRVSSYIKSKMKAWSILIAMAVALTICYFVLSSEIKRKEMSIDHVVFAKSAFDEIADLIDGIKPITNYSGQFAIQGISYAELESEIGVYEISYQAEDTTLCKIVARHAFVQFGNVKINGEKARSEFSIKNRCALDVQRVVSFTYKKKTNDWN